MRKPRRRDLKSSLTFHFSLRFGIASPWDCDSPLRTVLLFVNARQTLGLLHQKIRKRASNRGTRLNQPTPRASLDVEGDTGRMECERRRPRGLVWTAGGNMRGHLPVVPAGLQLGVFTFAQLVRVSLRLGQWPGLGKHNTRTNCSTAARETATSLFSHPSKTATARTGEPVPPRILSGKPMKRKRPRPIS